MRLTFLSGYFLLVAICNKLDAQLHGPLVKGKYAVGFNIINTTGSDQKPMRICIWYPAETGGETMKLADYADIGSIGGSENKQALRNDLKNTVEFVFDRRESPIPQADFDKALSSAQWAVKDAKMAKGKWPLIISDTEPTSLLPTMEWLASQGYIIAIPAMQYGPPKDETAYYTGPTAGLSGLLIHMQQQPYIEQDNISALGFGGGAMAPFFVAMQTDRLKAMVSIEGGLFMPESKTTLSPDYAPAKFATPLLHIATTRIIAGENIHEFNAVKAKKYRLAELFNLQHHDFTIYGRIYNGLLKLRGNEASAADNAFLELHDQMLYFFRNRRPDEGRLNQSSRFKLESF